MIGYLQFFWQIEIHWKSQLTFLKYNPAHIIMLPGDQYKNVTIQSEGSHLSNISAKTRLTSYWIPEKHQLSPVSIFSSIFPLVSPWNYTE